MSKSMVRVLIDRHLPFFLSMPALMWQILFFYIPALFVLGMSISPGLGFGITLAHYAHCFTISYGGIIVRSLLLSVGTAVCCLILAYPVCYYLALNVERGKNILLFLLIVPFWTSVMVQIYSWFFLLERSGLVNSLLLKLGIISEPLILLNNTFAVYVVMIYCYVPFMIMPLYTQLEKLDRGLLEASADLGASAWQTFRRITLPLSVPGIQTGFFLVLVPCFGDLAIPPLLSGGKQLFVGSLIAQFFVTARQPHVGAAFTVLSGIVLAITVGLLYLYFTWLCPRMQRGDS